MGKKLVRGSPCLRNSAVGELKGGFIDYLAKGLGRLGILRAAVGNCGLRMGNAFSLPFPLGAGMCFPCGSLGCGAQTHSAPTVMELRIRAIYLPNARISLFVSAGQR